MHLQCLEIEGYRSFDQKQSIKFAIPNNGKGSGLTLIVGPNNVGKTTFIEALSLYKGKSITQNEKREGLAPKIRVSLIGAENEISDYICETAHGGSEVLCKGTPPKFGFIPSRRHWDTNFTGSGTLGNLNPHSALQTCRGNKQDIKLANFLSAINSDEELKKKFDSLLTKLVPDFKNWTIDEDRAGKFVRYDSENGKHESTYLGDGIISLFRICAHLVIEENCPLIIDEPELSLHPISQKSLSNFLSEIATKRQVIICTHSPYFASWEDFINGAVFIRINKVKGMSKTFCLNHEAEYCKHLQSDSDYQRPQLLDLVSKEILFSERILFVEGQEDVGIIKKYLKDTQRNVNFDIFGYGVGGHSNMGSFIKMAKDLGLSKIAALYDNDKKAQESYEKDKGLYSGKDISFYKLLTEDIRDKDQEKCEECGKIYKEEKTGTFKGDKIKDNSKLGFEELINSIITFME